MVNNAEELKMSKKKKPQPWDEKWKKPENSLIGSGGQGQTYKVEPKTNEFPSSQYVLKILTKEQDPERRARMYREVAVLKTLKHKGIPKLIDSNVDEFESEVKLYMVTEFIEGMTLEKAIENATMEPEDAINFLLKLLEIVDYCHRANVLHRDIKPDNIILRNNNINDPVLIDFGMSFNKVDLEETNLTPIGQQLGNRFLFLPEQKIKSSAQRSPISDITQCCGILFYAITGVPPVSLTDHEGKMPHQQDRIRAYLSEFPSNLINRIFQIFNRGFQTEILYRWSSIEELKDALINVQNPPAKSQDTIIAEIKNLFSIPEHERRKLFEIRANELAVIIFDSADKASKQLNELLGGGFGIMLTYGYHSFKPKPKAELDWENLEFYVEYGITLRRASQKFSPLIKGCLRGSEIVLFHEVVPGTRRNGTKPPPFLSGFSEDKYEDIELCRTLLNESCNPSFLNEMSNYSLLSRCIKNYYFEGVKKMLEANEAEC